MLAIEALVIRVTGSEAYCTLHIAYLLEPRRVRCGEYKFFCGLQGIRVCYSACSPFGSRLGAQPQRGVSRLHRLPNHPYQIVAQGFQVGLVPELGGEGFQGLPRVVLPAVEAAVDERLDARRRGLNSAAITRVETTTARVDSWPVRTRKTPCSRVTPPK